VTVLVAGQNNMLQLVCCRIIDESDAVFVTEYHAQCDFRDEEYLKLRVFNLHKSTYAQTSFLI
jgi:hypothetical protein